MKVETSEQAICACLARYFQLHTIDVSDMIASVALQSSNFILSFSRDSFEVREVKTRNKKRWEKNQEKATRRNGDAASSRASSDGIPIGEVVPPYAMHDPMSCHELLFK